MNIKNYVDASDFAQFIATEFDKNCKDVYDRLLEDDYLEGSLGAIWTTGDYIESEIAKGNEKAEWYLAFLIAFNLKEIRLKY